MYYSNQFNPYSNYNVRNINYRPNYRSDSRLIGGGGFLFPFALGFVSSPLIFGATRPSPPFYPGQFGPRQGRYFPYY